MIVFQGTWGIVVNREKFGPYASQEEALLIARTWAENATKQGHQVRVLIGRSGGDRSPSDDPIGEVQHTPTSAG
jgi:hypothetical protein